MRTDHNIHILDPEKPLDADGRARIAALARRQREANGAIMKFVTGLGNSIEHGIARLPKTARDALDTATREALLKVYDAGTIGAISGEKPKNPKAAIAMGMVTGALGGMGGMATTIAELPFTTALIFRAVQDVAEEHGFPRDDPMTKRECIIVFGSGTQAGDDDGVDTAFYGARIALTGSTVNGLIGKIAPRFAATISQKLATQAIPIMGAIAGAGSNYVFMTYYTELAHVHFGLRKLAEEYEPQAVYDAFHADIAR